MIAADPENNYDHPLTVGPMELVTTGIALLVLLWLSFTSPLASPTPVIRIYVLALAFMLSLQAWRDPVGIVSAKNIFWASLIYIILLNPAVGSPVLKEYPPEVVSKAAWLVLLFTLMVLIGYASMHRTPRGARWLAHVPSLNVDVLFYAIWGIAAAELIRRLAFTGWSFHGMINDQLLGRSGEVRFSRGQFGDWRVILQPISMLWSWLPVIAAIYWIKERPRARKFTILIPVLAVFATAFLGGTRAAIVVPLAAVAVIFVLSSPPRVGRWLMIAGCIALFVLAPLLDLMEQYRGKGWQGLDKITLTAKNPLEAKRDTNFESLTHLIHVVPSQEPHRPATELYYYLAISPIPRFLWPGKPWMSQEYLGKARKAYASISCVGDMYFYGGVLHVIIGGFVFGLILRWLDGAWDATEKRLEPMLVYVYIALHLGSGLRALWNLVAAGVVFAVLLALLFALRYASRFRSTHMAPE